MISIKRGDTFSFIADVTDESGIPITVSTSNIKSQIRDEEYELVCNLDISKTDVEGEYLLKAEDTESWGVYVWGENKLLMDIEFNINGAIISSDTIEIFVTKDVSY